MGLLTSFFEKTNDANIENSFFIKFKFSPLLNLINQNSNILLLSLLILPIMSILSISYYDSPFVYGDHVPELCGSAPINGTYFITSDCLLDADFTSSRHVLIQNDSVLTIPNNVILTVIFGNNVIIESGSGLLINSGGALNWFA